MLTYKRLVSAKDMKGNAIYFYANDDDEKHMWLEKWRHMVDAYYGVDVSETKIEEPTKESIIETLMLCVDLADDEGFLSHCDYDTLIDCLKKMKEEK